MTKEDEAPDDLPDDDPPEDLYEGSPDLKSTRPRSDRRRTGPIHTPPPTDPPSIRQIQIGVLTDIFTDDLNAHLAILKRSRGWTASSPQQRQSILDELADQIAYRIRKSGVT